MAYYGDISEKVTGGNATMFVKETVKCQTSNAQTA
jgi:hypothetical protein